MAVGKIWGPVPPWPQHRTAIGYICTLGCLLSSHMTNKDDDDEGDEMVQSDV